LLDVAEALRDAGRAERPGFGLALNLYYETALNPRFGLAWFSQDLDAAAARDFRWLAIMGYHRQVADELGLDDDGLSAALQRMAARLAEVPGARERVLVKLQAIDWRTREPVPPAELARAAAPFAGFARCVAPADDAAAATALLSVLGRP
jgi:biofilm PGA synthesis lipoprotein PgaB